MTNFHKLHNLTQGYNLRLQDKVAISLLPASHKIAAIRVGDFAQAAHLQ